MISDSADSSNASDKTPALPSDLSADVGDSGNQKAVLSYATGETPMLGTPFPSHRTTAWVMLALTMFCIFFGAIGLMWLGETLMESDQPIGAFACVLAPVAMLLAVMLGLIRETISAFRRAQSLTDANGVNAIFRQSR